MLQSVFLPHWGCQYRFGRLAPKILPRVRLGSYLLRAQLPEPPAACSYGALAQSALAQMYLNDRLGICVPAGGYHVVGVATGNASGGNPFLATSEQLIRDYAGISGFDPSQTVVMPDGSWQNPTDQGCDEVQAFQYWMQQGWANGTKLLGYVAIDANDPREIQLAAYLFENLFYGLGLPRAYISPPPSRSGFVWDAAGPSIPTNGHCIVGFGYNPQGTLISTWGLTGVMTWRAMAQYLVPQAGGMLYALLTPDILLKGQQKAPSAIAWNDLVADFDALGGTVPVPLPPVPPSPVPQPPSPPMPPTPAPVQLPDWLKTFLVSAIDDAFKKIEAMLGAHPVVDSLLDSLRQQLEAALGLTARQARRLALPSLAQLVSEIEAFVGTAEKALPIVKQLITIFETATAA